MPVTDITKPIDLTGHPQGTGPLRTRRPVYVDFMPPCNSACPAGENIQAWLSHAQAGNYFDAFQALVADNPFPAIMGRICVKPCETGCNRTHIDNTVNIHAVERFIGDEAIRLQWPINTLVIPAGKRVLVVGSGPGGLSAAYHLARLGYEVEVFERDASPGGLLRTGIPEYRLPKNILDAEIERIVKMGVKFTLNHEVKDLLKEKEAGKFDAIYLSTGAQQINAERIPSDQSIPVTDAFSFFKDAAIDSATYQNKKIVVYGGGKLALYLSRILKRFASEAIVFFPGDKKLMPAYDYETDDALAEGVTVQLLTGISKIEKNHLVLEKMKVEKGKAVTTGESEIFEADMVIIAMGQEAETNFLRQVNGIQLKEDGTIVINTERMSGFDGIFAGGDMLPGETRSATIAIGHGKKASKYIDAFLRKETFLKGEKHATAGYRKLQMWYKTEAPLMEQDKLIPSIAIKNFDEVISGLTEKEARYEAQRCLSCGNCFECDGCFGACPEDAIIKLGAGKRYKFNFNLCTGCAMCYEQCPCHAIEMIPEPDKH
ncbi:MAG: NAD(P)-binding protein [Chitinophagales bacterium]